MRIEVAVDTGPGLQGNVTVVDPADPATPVEFVGWLGLIHALSQVLEPAPSARPGAGAAEPQQEHAATGSRSPAASAAPPLAGSTTPPRIDATTPAG